jgi:hypothetical protein
VLAWTASFLALARGAIPSSKAFADDLVRDFCSDAPFSQLGIDGVGACREWPRGVERKADAVGGPIIHGWGTGASALAIAATGANGLADWRAKLLALSDAASFMMHGERPLERAILAWGARARPWL